MKFYTDPQLRNRYTIECWLEGEEDCSGYRVTGIRTLCKAWRLQHRHNVRQHPQGTRAQWEQRMAEGQSG